VRIAVIVLGLLALAAAILALAHPALTAVTLTWILGIWLMVRGVFGLVGALVGGGAVPRGALLLTAALDLVVGILFATHPGHAAIGIAVLMGILAIVWGVAFVGLGLAMRRESAGTTPAAS